MKTLKRSVAILLSVLMLLSVISVATVSASDETLAYFVNSYGWDAVYSHVWVEDDAGNGTGLDTWPGLAADLVDAEKGIYSRNVTNETMVGEFILWHNNQADSAYKATGNLTLEGVVGKYYEPKTKAFYDTADAAIEAASKVIDYDYYVCGTTSLCGSQWLLSDTTCGMTKNDDGSYSKTFENVAAGDHEFKVNNGTWNENYPAQNYVLKVETAGSTVVITLSADKAVTAKVTAPTQETTEPSESETTPSETTSRETTPNETTPSESTAPGTETDPSENTEPVTTNPVKHAKKEVSFDFNTETDDVVNVTFSLQAAEKFVNGEGYITYDSSALSLKDFKLLNVNGKMENTDLYNEICFNFTDIQSPSDFTTEKEFIVISFNVIKDGATQVSLNLTELNSVVGNTDIPLITEGVIVGDFTLNATSSITKKEIPTVPPTDPTTEPTQPETKTPVLKIKKTNLKAGQTTTASVSNKNGQKVTYTSSNAKVASVNKNTGVITALTKGSATITAKIGTKKLTQKITVSTNPVIKAGKKVVKNKSIIVVAKKGVTFKLDIIGKAKSIKNKVTVKNKKIAKVTSKATKSYVTIKTLKKGKTKLTIKINNYMTYTYTIKVKK